jgi:hypothetical protein
METNYYALLKCKEEDNERDGVSNILLHIGHASRGWIFNFRCYGDNDVSFTKLLLSQHTIKSYGDWLKILSQPNCQIISGYGERLTLDEFKAVVDSHRDKNKNYETGFPPNHERFADECGNCFIKGNFAPQDEVYTVLGIRYAY